MAKIAKPNERIHNNTIGNKTTTALGENLIKTKQTIPSE
jgi:hypothetical protein